MPTPPDDKRCRATTKGGIVHGAYWSPPKRCSHWARENGYCRLHQADGHDGEEGTPGRLTPDDPARA